MEVVSEESGSSMETVTRSMTTTMESSSISSTQSSSVQIQSTNEAGAVDENANAIEAPVTEAPAEIAQENIKTQLQEIISEIEQNVVPEDEEEVEVTKEQEDAVKSLVEQELKLMQEEEAMLAQQDQQHDEEVKGVENEDVVVVEAVKEVEPDASTMKEEELKAMEAERAAAAGGSVPSSNEIWNVEGIKVTFPHETEEGYYEEYDENGQPLYHTWKPKGKYEVIKTEVTHQDISAIKVADPKLSEVPKPVAPAPKSAAQEAAPVQNGMPIEMRDINGYAEELAGLSPGLDIPAGIPLLARILPKDSNEVDRKISLERLFTPATDSPDLTPTRNKKVFASSAFYRPDHPTIDDQVDLAQRISHSLINDDNKMSRGQTMYIKRKKRSVRWIHAEEQGLDMSEFQEDDDEGPHGPGLVDYSEPDHQQRTPVDRGAMKLMMSSKQEKVDQVYHSSEMESPTGKGAALFAKRKKRMDKYIVDENTVQQSQTATAHQQTSVMSSSSMQSSSMSHSQSNQQMMVGGALTGPTNITYGTPGVAAGGDVIYTAECKVVQRSHPATPSFDLPSSGGLLADLTTDDKREKRKSFNLAAKGFGTYNNFYTPVHLGQKAC